jgi:predicted dinucleotide-utilizing enzyme
VLLRTTKQPASLGLAVQQRTLLFQGTAAECIKHYPRNINVAVALSLAAEHEVEVELWADPAVDRNSHEVIVSGEFGEAHLATFNLPCPDNPATSYLAALSILSLLKNLGRAFQVGT